MHGAVVRLDRERDLVVEQALHHDECATPGAVGGSGLRQSLNGARARHRVQKRAEGALLLISDHALAGRGGGVGRH